MFWKLVALIIQQHRLISADDKLKEKVPTEAFQTPKISIPILNRRALERRHLLDSLLNSASVFTS